MDQQSPPSEPDAATTSPPIYQSLLYRITHECLSCDICQTQDLAMTVAIHGTTHQGEVELFNGAACPDCFHRHHDQITALIVRGLRDQAARPGDRMVAGYQEAADEIEAHARAGTIQIPVIPAFALVNEPRF